VCKDGESQPQVFRIVYEEGLPDGFSYACEKLGVAVWKLATGWGTLRERLQDAAMELVILQEADFPDDLVEEWKSIIHDLTKGRMKYRRVIKDGEFVDEPVGLIVSTVGYARKETLLCLARRICNLESRMTDSDRLDL
jgi:hypothetical protein